MATHQHNVRQEAWERSMYELKGVLDGIPFTATQRRDIDEYLDDLTTSFVEANKAAAEFEEN